MGLRTGTDIIEIDRIQKAVTDKIGLFVSKVYTPQEINYCESKKQSKFQSYAVRFAAKEAVSKALGTGLARGITFLDIEIVNLPSGQPSVLLSGRAKSLFQEMGGRTLTLSMSHCKNYAVAMVVLETMEGVLDDR